jgi:hypothetical protein
MNTRISGWALAYTQMRKFQSFLLLAVMPAMASVTKR